VRTSSEETHHPFAGAAAAMGDRAEMIGRGPAERSAINVYEIGNKMVGVSTTPEYGREMDGRPISEQRGAEGALPRDCSSTAAKRRERGRAREAA